MQLKKQRDYKKFDRIRFRPSIPTIIRDANHFEESEIIEGYLQWDMVQREWKFLDGQQIRTLFSSGTALSYYIFTDTDPTTTPIPDTGEYQLVIYNGILYIKDDQGNIFTPPASISSDRMYAVDGQSKFQVDANFSMLTSAVSVNGNWLADTQYTYNATDPGAGGNPAITLTGGFSLKKNDLMTVIY